LGKNYQLFSKNDLRFLEQVYKILLAEFALKPQITKEQFLSLNYLEQKVSMTCEVVNKVLAETQQSIALQKPKASKSSTRKE